LGEKNIVFTATLIYDWSNMKLDEQIKHINDKLQLLLNRFQSLKKENERLRQELKQLKLGDAEKTTQVETLIQRVEVLKAAKSQMSETEKRAFEKRINQYLREIEKCITMMQE
jgi:uncharacterized phage infection (PIP) family protein YhgE